MNILFIILGGFLAATLLGEAILWRIFAAKMTPLSFPHQFDTSYFRFFSLARLRIAAVIHAIAVAAILVFFCFYLW